MADLPYSQLKINDIEVSADAPITEALWAKVGGAINFLLDRSLKVDVFTANGTWVCPSGVNRVFLFGCGGGGGGSGTGAFLGSFPEGFSGAGGNGAVPFLTTVPVTPTLSYAITIGAGGTGTVGTMVSVPGDSYALAGGSGGNTTFGSLVTYYGAKGGRGRGTKTFVGSFSSTIVGYGGSASFLNENRSGLYTLGGDAGNSLASKAAYVDTDYQVNNATFMENVLGVPPGSLPSAPGRAGQPSPYAVGGTGGGGFSTIYGAGGGGAGLGPGANAPNVTPALNQPAIAGNSALSTNYGAGGSGAASATGGSSVNAAGGNGAPGILFVIYYGQQAV